MPTLPGVPEPEIKRDEGVGVLRPKARPKRGMEEAKHKTQLLAIPPGRIITTCDLEPTTRRCVGGLWQ